MGHQLLVGIHFIVMFFGELAGHAQCLAIGEQKNTHGRKNHGKDRFKRYMRNGNRGQPLRQHPGNIDAIGTAQVEEGTDHNGGKQHHQPCRDLLIPARQQEQQRQGRCPYEERYPIGLGQLFDDRE